MNSYIKIIFLILTTIISSCGGTRQNNQHKISEIETHVTVESSGVPIDYASYGSGEYTLLFVHGWCINQTYWEEQVRFLQSDYHIITMDLPGHGQSGRNRTNWSIENFGRDVRTLIDQLKLTNVILIGHSMGGDIALEAAIENEEVVAVIGIDNFKDVGAEYDQDIKNEIAYFLQMLKSNFSAVAPAYAEGSLFHASTDSLIKSRVMSDYKNSDSIAATGSLESLFSYAEMEADKLKALSKKLYLINSNASPTDISGLKTTGVDFQLIEIDSTGHFPMIEKPVEFNKLLKQTIVSIEGMRRYQ